MDVDYIGKTKGKGKGKSKGNSNRKGKGSGKPEKGYVCGKRGNFAP